MVDYDYIEQLIKDYVYLLKPGLEDKFVWRVSDEDSNAYAITTHYNPPMITFYLKNIVKMTDKPIKQSIKELLSHELIHVLQHSQHNYKDEREAVDRFQKLNFFKDV